MKLLLKGFFLVVVNITMITGAYAQTDLPRGQVIDRVQCVADSTHAYSLYLPSNYSPDKKWPVIFIYHAGGMGKQSVLTFRKAAEAYGYILIGSYNFRNGSMLAAVEAAKTLFEEVPKRFSADENRFFTAGLSGGARMASSMAINMPNVRGVIASAAGFNSAIQPAKGHDYMYVSVMGNRDFNYAELQETHLRLDELDIPNHMISFDGSHHWPPEDQLVKALSWIEMYSMTKGLKPPDQPFVERFKSNQTKDIETLLRNGESVLANQHHNDLSLLGLDPEDAKKPDQTYQKQFKTFNKRLQSELAQQQVVLQKLNTIAGIPINELETWWKSKVTVLVRKARKHKDPKEQLMAQRLLSFIAVYVLPHGRNQLMAGRPGDAIFFYLICYWTHPENPTLTYFMAKLYSLDGQNQNAMLYYNKAIKLGYKSDLRDRTAILEQLKDTTEFARLSQGLWRGLI